MAWLSGVGSDQITIHHCLFASNADRSPKLQGGRYDVVNNVIYNWSHHNAVKLGEGAQVNLVKNLFIPGPQSTASEGCILPEDPDEGTRLYLAGNVTSLTPSGDEDQWRNVVYWQRTGEKWIKHYPAPEILRAARPLEAAAVQTQSAKAACDLVLARAGAKIRDANDRRIIQEVENPRRAGLKVRNSDEEKAMLQPGSSTQTRKIDTMIDQETRQRNDTMTHFMKALCVLILGLGCLTSLARESEGSRRIPSC